MSSTEFDPYAVLGVARTATPNEIKAAYRELVNRYHPDRHQGNPLEELAAAKLAEINRAYELLSDPARRADYDASRSGWRDPTRPSPGGRTVDGQGRKGKSWLYLLALILFFPLVIRFGAAIARLVARLVRFATQGLAAARGTPLLLVLILVTVATAVFLYLRRRRRNRS